MENSKEVETSSRQLVELKRIIWAILTFSLIVVMAALYFTHSYADAAFEELDAIRSEDIQFAYKLTSSVYQKQTSFAAFEAFVNKHPILKDFIDLNFSEKKMENNIGHLAGTITGSNGKKQKIKLEMVKERDEWKVKALELIE